MKKFSLPSRLKKRISVLAVMLAVLLFGYQNCAQQNFSSSKAPTTSLNSISVGTTTTTVPTTTTTASRPPTAATPTTVPPTTTTTMPPAPMPARLDLCDGPLGAVASHVEQLRRFRQLNYQNATGNYTNTSNFASFLNISSGATVVTGMAEGIIGTTAGVLSLGSSGGGTSSVFISMNSVGTLKDNWASATELFFEGNSIGEIVVDTAPNLVLRPKSVGVPLHVGKIKTSYTTFHVIACPGVVIDEIEIGVRGEVLVFPGAEVKKITNYNPQGPGFDLVVMGKVGQALAVQNAATALVSGGVSTITVLPQGRVDLFKGYNLRTTVYRDGGINVIEDLNPYGASGTVYPGGFINVIAGMPSQSLLFYQGSNPNGLPAGYTQAFQYCNSACQIQNDPNGYMSTWVNWRNTLNGTYIWP